MALVRCKECGKEISGSAETCPHCGCKTAHGQVVVQNKTWGMQLLIHIACVAIGLFLVLCNAGTFFELLDKWEYINKYWYETSFLEYLSDKEQMAVFWKMVFGSVMLIGGIVDAVVVYMKLVNNTKASQPHESEVMQIHSDDWKCTCGRVNRPYVSTCACGRSKYIGEVEAEKNTALEKWRCVGCGTENAAKVKYCQNCGVTKEWSEVHNK